MENTDSDWVTTSRFPKLDIVFRIFGVLGCLFSLFSFAPFIGIFWLGDYLTLLEVDTMLFTTVLSVKLVVADFLLAIGLFGLARQSSTPLAVLLTLSFMPYPLLLGLSYIGIFLVSINLVLFVLNLVKMAAMVLVGILMFRLRGETSHSGLYIFCGIAFLLAAVMNWFVGISLAGFEFSLLLVIFLRDSLLSEGDYTKH